MTNYTHDELLSEHSYERPLVVDGVTCHGGFIDGRYVSPRTRRRVPAIEAWQKQLAPGALDAILEPLAGESLPGLDVGEQLAVAGERQRHDPVGEAGQAAADPARHDVPERHLPVGAAGEEVAVGAPGERLDQREVGGDELGGVDSDQPDAGAPVDAGRHEPAARRLDPGAQLAVGDGAATGDEGGPVVRVALDDGGEVTGFLCEAHAIEEARDITTFGGWRAWRAAQNQV